MSKGTVMNDERDVLESLKWSKQEATWDTSEGSMVLNRKYAEVFFPNGWGMSFVTGNDVGMWASEDTYQISVLNPQSEIAYHFGEIKVGNTTYCSDDIWGYVPASHVNKLVQWVASFAGNMKHKLISGNTDFFDYDDDYFAGLKDVGA